MQSEISLPREILSSVEQALAEDIGSGDVTTNSIVPAEATLEGTMVAKQFGVAAGLSIAQLVFQVLDKRVNFSPRTSDSESVKAGQILAAIRGPARAILSGERTALNFVGRTSRHQDQDPRHAQDGSEPPRLR